VPTARPIRIRVGKRNRQHGVALWGTPKQELMHSLHELKEYVIFPVSLNSSVEG